MGLGSLTSIGGYVRIDENNALTSLTGIGSLTYIGGDFEITKNYVLTSLTGLESLNTISGSLSIGKPYPYNGINPLLADLTALNNLTSIGSDLTIVLNFSLKSLTGFDNLTSIGGILWVANNDSLTSLSGLDNIDASSIIGLYIVGNYVLSTCEVKSICDYLVSPNGSIQIIGNATGCYDRQEVEAACESLSVEYPIVCDGFSIYPNPSSTFITVETPVVPIKSQLYILNLNGQQLITQQITKPLTNIDISTLRNGVYLVELRGERIFRGKMVVN